MSQDIAVAELSRRIFRYWWIPVLLAVIGTAVGLGAARTVPAPHRAQASVLVGSTAGSVTHSSTIKARQDLATFYAARSSCGPLSNALTCTPRGTCCATR